MIKLAKRGTWLDDLDVRLMLRVRDGDDDAFAELFVRHERWLNSFFMSSVGYEEEELTQEVFLRVHRARGRYEATAKFSTWLYTIAQNVARNAICRKKPPIPMSQYAGEQQLGNILAEPRHTSPETIAACQEGVRQVHSAIAQLAPRQRDALRLFVFEDLCYEEIAKVIETTHDGVRCLLTRARRNLRTLLESTTVCVPLSTTSAPRKPR